MLPFYRISKEIEPEMNYRFVTKDDRPANCATTKIVLDAKGPFTSHGCEGRVHFDSFLAITSPNFWFSRYFEANREGY